MGISPAVAREEDLTAKARLRNAALELFAEHGPEATSLRAVATQAGVTVGLIVHHFGTKEALRKAVEASIVERFADAIASVPLGSEPDDRIVAARDAAVAEMLASSPAVVDYLRRSVLARGGQRGDLLSQLSALSATQAKELRDAGVVSTAPSVAEQVITMMVRQLGRLFLQPLVDRIVEEFSDEDAGARAAVGPQLQVSVTRPPEPRT